MTRQVPAVVLGASGYVGAEFLRLVQAHPHLRLVAAVSESSAGKSIESVFPHLPSVDAPASFRSRAELPGVLGGLEGESDLAVFSAANHGFSAPLVAEILELARDAELAPRVVDTSADFRFGSPQEYEAVYGAPHGAPALLASFARGLPEHVELDAIGDVARHVGHPGCFTTAVLLAIVPLLKLQMVEPDLYVVGITGSTGSGREPKPTTHHPVRHGNLFAYQPLRHRHVPEMRSLAEQATGVLPALRFVPHSGPFARGIHVTVQGVLRTAIDEKTVRSELARFYQASPFVRVDEGTPRMKDVVGGNFARLGVSTEGTSVAVFSVIDNLVKGAAGGSVQWMNRLLGFSEASGLTSPGPGWI